CARSHEGTRRGGRSLRLRQRPDPASCFLSLNRLVQGDKPLSLLSSLRASRLLPVVTLLVMIAPLLPRRALADTSSLPSPGGQAGVYDAAVGVPETGGAIANGSSV